MLTNYNAEAVAEVMGIVFVRDGKDPSPVDALKLTDRKAPKRPIETRGTAFAIHIDGLRMHVVGWGAASGLVQGTPPKTFRDFLGSFESGRAAPPTSALIEKAVERGLPRQALRHVAEWLVDGDQAKASILEWKVVPRTTLERRKLQLSPKESELTERVARLSVHARRALGTEAEARQFMTSPHAELDGRSPLDAAATDFGSRRAEQILNALEYGLAL